MFERVCAKIILVSIGMWFVFLFPAPVFYHSAQAVSLQDATMAALKYNDKIKIADLELRKVKNDFNASMAAWLPVLNLHAGYQLTKAKSNLPEALNYDLWIQRVQKLTNWVYDQAPAVISGLSHDNVGGGVVNFLQVINKVGNVVERLGSVGGYTFAVLSRFYAQLFPNEPISKQWIGSNGEFIPGEECLWYDKKNNNCNMNMINARKMFGDLFDRKLLNHLVVSMADLSKEITKTSLTDSLQGVYEAARNLLSLNTQEETAAMIRDVQTIAKSISVSLENLLAIRDADVVRATATLTWNLFNGGQDVVNLQNARLEHRKQSARMKKTMIEVIYDTVDVYTNLYFIKRNLEIVKNSLEMAKKVLNGLRLRFEKGLISELDLASAELMVMKIEKEVYSLKLHHDLAESRYLNVVGTLHEDLSEPVAPIVPSHNNKNFFAGLSKTHLDLVMARYDVMHSKNNSYASLAKLLPTAVIRVDYVRDMNLDNLKKLSDHWTANLDINWNIFNAGRDIINIYTANLDQRIAFLNLQQTYRTVSANIMDDIFEVEKLRLELDFQDLNRDYNSRKLKKIEIEIEGGLMSIEDLVKTFAEFVQSESQLLNAKRSLIIKSYKLLKDMGTLSIQDLV